MDELYLILAIPVITALVGWGTNWAAVKMIFYPVRFVGIGKLGWQGIIYKSAPVLAAGVGDMMGNNLVTAKEMSERLDGEQIADFVDQQLEAEGEPIVAACAETVAPGSWQNMAPAARQTLMAQFRRELRAAVKDTADRVNQTVEQVLDVKELVVHALSGENAGVLANLMKTMAAQELKFIEYYGGIFGLVIGIIEMVAWKVVGEWWVMPIVGVVVGLVTNYLAILMIFRPVEPTRYLGIITYQGLFPKRQVDIARDYGRSTADVVLTPQNLINKLSQGEAGAKLQGVVTKTASQRFDELRGRAEGMLPVELDDAVVDRVKATAWEKGRDLLPTMRGRFEDFLKERLRIAEIVEEKLLGLSKKELEGLLRPLFKEDEWILIAVGGFLGGCVGVLQGAIVLALG